jgi:uncharacterized protein (DUF1015 family)
MAQILPFQPYRYTPAAGPLDAVVTQPYDKISPEMQARYLALSPYNLVRIILGDRRPADTAEDNVYTRAARPFDDWIASSILAREAEPSLYAYFQEFCDPDTGERLLRKGFIGLGPVAEYSEGIVYRHEQTHTGPKRDRLELLNHTRAHFEQLFLLYSDPACEIDRLLEEAAANPPDARVTDEYQAIHSLWKISSPERLAAIQGFMSDKKLLIADGHHRYETALAFRQANPALAAAAHVQMTFVNMHSPGLRILATHRLFGGLDGFDASAFIARAGLRPAGDSAALRRVWAEPHPGLVRVGVAFAGLDSLYLYEAPREAGALDVSILHERLISGTLGVSEEAVRELKNIRYVRGLDPALNEIASGAAQLAFLLEPTSVEDTARIAFSGGVMPQKSTDFYPKLLSGLTVYKL